MVLVALFVLLLWNYRAIASLPEVIFCSFGHMLRVPESWSDREIGQTENKAYQSQRDLLIFQIDFIHFLVRLRL